MVSVTRVEMSANLKNAYVYLSIFGPDEVKQQLTFKAIQHAHSRLQSYVADDLESKFCPVLHLKLDEVFKKTLETMRLIDKATQEFDDDGEEV
jgi:ribosome-binding factor A